nr:MAG TPA: Putative extracellular protein hydrolase [Herelleviridae sp.]
MEKEKEAKQVIDRFVDNFLVYSELTNTLIEEKNNEAREFMRGEALAKILNIRPYPEVIRSLSSYNVQYEKFEDNGNNLQAIISYRKISYPNNTTENASDSLAELVIDLTYLHDGWVIDSFDEEQDILYADYFQNLSDEDETSGSYNISQFLIKNYKKYANIKYMYKKNTKEDLFMYNEDVYTDSFNMLYWLLVREGIPVTEEYDRNNLLSTELFDKVFDKGHKYKYNINEMIEGDILYFGKNDSNIGIYIGDDRYITVTGKFPKDSKQGLDIHDLIKDWEQFNGKVIRLKEWY